MLGDDERSLTSSTVAVVTVFVKLPRPGFVKTRLAEGVGAERAAEFYRACAERTVDVVCRCPGVECTVAYAPADAGEEIRGWLGAREGNPPLRFAPQLDVPDLGARMRAALNQGLAGDEAAAASAAVAASLVVGSDVPDLGLSDVRAAVEALVEMEASTEASPGDDKATHFDCILGPAADGGFWVVGVRGRKRKGSGGDDDNYHVLPDALFEGITWSTSQVFAAAAASIKACGLELAPEGTLRELADIDTVADLAAWRRRRKAAEEESGGEPHGLVSVVDAVLER